MRIDKPDDWDARDLIDQTAPYISEDDPWDPISFLTQVPSLTSPDPSNSDASDTPSLAPLKDLKKDGRLDDTPAKTSSPQTAESPDSHLDSTEYWPDDDAEPLKEPIPFTDYDPDDQSDSTGYWSEDRYEADPNTYPIEEPIPFIDYDPDLGEEIYQRVESIDLTNVDIMLDLFLSSVTLSQGEDRQIRRHFEDFSRARLSNWLAWLNSKEWTGETLMLFVRFHNHWESNPEWWEIIWYHPIHGWQWQKSTSSILSRNEAYHIVQCRIDFPPDAIIDPVWFEEWECQRLWRHGFYSFAAFAKFRAALGGDEDWESLIERRSVEEDLWLAALWDTEEQVLQSSNKGRTVGWADDVFLYSYTTSLSRWYEIQDWYPKSEWHDNLS